MFSCGFLPQSEEQGTFYGRNKRHKRQLTGGTAGGGFKAEVIALSPPPSMVVVCMRWTGNMHWECVFVPVQLSPPKVLWRQGVSHRLSDEQCLLRWEVAPRDFSQLIGESGQDCPIFKLSLRVRSPGGEQKPKQQPMSLGPAARQNGNHATPGFSQQSLLTRCTYSARWRRQRIPRRSLVQMGPEKIQAKRKESRRGKNSKLPLRRRERRNIIAFSARNFFLKQMCTKIILPTASPAICTQRSTQQICTS